MATKEELLRQQQETDGKGKPLPAATPSGEKTEKQKAEDAEAIVRQKQAEVESRRHEITLAVIKKGFESNEAWEASLKQQQADIDEQIKRVGKTQLELQNRIETANQKIVEANAANEKAKRWHDAADKEMTEATKIKESIETTRVEIEKQRDDLEDRIIAYDVGCQPAVDAILNVAKAIVQMAGRYQDANAQQFADWLCGQADQIECLVTPQPKAETLDEDTVAAGSLDEETGDLDIGEDASVL